MNGTHGKPILKGFNFTVRDSDSIGDTDIYGTV